MMALDEAHANGVLHRDLKPENIMIEDRRTAKDHVKVVDFGIAKLEENNPNSKRSFQTRTGIVCGTPEYMSPEQARGQKLDARSDLYAIGVMLFHMTTDRLPFEAPSPIEVVTKHISEPPVPPRTFRPDLPEALERLILTLLEKDREKRPPSAMDVHAELERIDRELALERRERIAEKTSDDATQVDMRPISQLIEAIDAMGVIGAAVADGAAATRGSAVQVGVIDGHKKSGGQDDPTDQTTRKELASNPRAMSLVDTIPEPQSKQLAKQVAEMSRAGTPTPVKPVPPIKPTANPSRGGAAARSSRVSGESRGSTTSKGRSSRDSGDVVSSAKSSGDGSRKRPPDASLVRENITVEAKPASEELVTSHKAKRAGKTSRSWVLWVVAGLAIAGGVTAVVVMTL
jgi:serine/threonine protein kinase